VDCVRREDITGITSLVLTEHGEALYLASSSLYQRMALSSGVPLRPSCRLTLPDGARPAAEVKSAAAGTGTAAEPGGVATDAKQRAVSGDSKRSGAAAETSFTSGADTTVDSHRDLLNSSEDPAAAARTTTTNSSGGGEPEVVEISTEEADRLLNGMRGLVNGVGDRDEKSVENYSEEKDGVKKSLEKSKETHISASEDDDKTMTAQREETERVLTTTESTSDSVTTRSKEEVKVVRTTRITAGTRVTEMTDGGSPAPAPAPAAAAAATTAATATTPSNGTAD